MTGSEAIWMTAVNSLASLIVKTGWEMGNKEIGTPIQQQIFKASGQYIKTYRNRHGNLKVLGMSRPVSLESIYTTVQLLDAKELTNFQTIEGLEKLYRKLNSRKLGGNKKNKQEGINVVNRERYLTVLGEPGVGKSTFLRKVGLEVLKGKEGKFRYDCIPVFLDLKSFDSDGIDIRQLIIEEFRICGFPDPEAFTTRALQQGRLLVLLDGLDEVPALNLTSVISKIQDFVDRYYKNRFITSCRTAAYHGFFKRFTDVAIAEFDDSQIKQFIHNWFQSELDKQAHTADKCWELLQSPENSAAMELAQTPLLLTFLCLVYDYSQNLPDNRSTLYRKALDILLEEWAAEKRIQRESIYKGLHTDLEKVLLSEIAYKKFEADQLFFQKQEVINQITDFLADTLNAPKHLDGKAVLHAIEVQQGILVKRAENIYSFSHLTIQEFLTARYIANNQKYLKKLLAESLTDDRWREVFLLVAGLVDSADDLLLEIEKQALRYLNTPILRSLLHEIDEIVVNMQGNYKKPAKRALAITSVLARTRILAMMEHFDLTFISNFKEPKFAINQELSRVQERAQKRARDLILSCDDFCVENLDRILSCDKIWSQDFTMIHSLDLVRNPSLSFNYDHNFKLILSNDEDRVLFLDLIFAKNCLNNILISAQEINSLANYLTANLLMVKCKQSAVRVSQKAWNDIEERMLTIPKE
ncbi:NACHT domain-containing protein [Leptothoe sp. ISB3NOV94-8A]